jgi:photosystem II stability/assembly factor-like uncharacterized protein
MIISKRILSITFKKSSLKLIFVIFACFMFSACSDDSEPSHQLTVEFGKQGLEDLISNRVIVTNDGTVLVATDQGAYKSIDEGESWQLVSPDNWNINDIVEIDTLHFMISAKNGETAFLSETFDGGETWSQLRTHFGPQDSQESQHINRLHWDESTQTLFGIGIDVLAKSIDRGGNWELVSGIWNGFGSGMRSIAYSSTENIALYGGQGAIENPILRKVDLSSLTQNFIDLTSLLPVPSTIEEIQFDSQDENILFVSGEGGIISSNDQGITWHPILLDQNSRFYFDFIRDERFTDHIYTAGWNKIFNAPQPLIIEISENGGETWRQFSHPNQNIFGGVRTMDILYEGDEAILFLGLYKGGVLKVYLS